MSDTDGGCLLIPILGAALLIAVFFALVYRDLQITAGYDAVCKRAGYSEREILSDRRAYCVEVWSDYRIAPWETVATAEAGE